MKNAKLLRILSVLDSSELRRLRDLIHSPFFNKNDKVKKLFEFLYPFAPDFEASSITEDKAFACLFPGAAPKKSVITKLSSKLLKLVHNFIELTHEDHSITHDINVLRFLSERGLANDFEQQLRKVKKDLYETPAHNASFLYQEFLVEQEIARLRVSRSDQGIGDVNYQLTAEALDKFYIAQKLIYLCMQYNRQQTINSPGYGFELLPQLLEYIPSSPYYQNSSIKTWFVALNFLRNPENKAYYTELRQLIFDKLTHLSEFEIRSLLSYLQNNARHIFENKEEYYHELFELYDFQLREKVFHPIISLTPGIFTNIVTVALLLDKKEWVAQFLQDHKAYSNSREDNVVDLCQAKLCFTRGDFSTALDHLNACYFKNIYFKLSERRLRLKVYYETDFFDILEDSINSFRKFLSKHKNDITTLHLNANRDFVNTLNSIFYTHPNKKQKACEIREQILKTKMLPEKAWLLQKVGSE